MKHTERYMLKGSSSCGWKKMKENEAKYLTETHLGQMLTESSTPSIKNVFCCGLEIMATDVVRLTELEESIKVSDSSVPPHSL